MGVCVLVWRRGVFLVDAVKAVSDGLSESDQ